MEKVYIAGGFGNYLDVERAITIGLLPDMPVDRFEFLGNTSIMGAYMALLSKTLRKDVEDIARKMTYLELSVSRSFMDEYVSSLFLPHTHADQFPTVRGAYGIRKKIIKEAEFPLPSGCFGGSILSEKLLFTITLHRQYFYFTFNDNFSPRTLPPLKNIAPAFCF